MCESAIKEKHDRITGSRSRSSSTMVRDRKTEKWDHQKGIMHNGPSLNDA
jgi:hypothetical protein